MLEESQSHLDGEAPVTDTLDAPADGVSEGAGQDPSSETVHPEGEEPEGDEQTFHEEGGRKFKTKEELISFYRQQRGAASRVARENKELTTRLTTVEAQLRDVLARNGAPVPAPSGPATEEPVDEQVRQAAELLRKVGKFVTADELKQMTAELNQLKQQSDTVTLNEARGVARSFMDINPDAEAYTEELADIIDKHFPKEPMERALDLAYRVHFGKAPRAVTVAAASREAYNKGKVNAVKRAQAGGGQPRSQPAGNSPEGKSLFNWEALR